MIRRAVLGGIATLALAVPAGAAAASCPGADVQPGPADTAVARKATLCLVNAERTSRGLRALRTNERLGKAAREHSHDMVARHYFDHVAPGGTDVVGRLRTVRYITSRISWAIGENIAWGEGELATPRAIVTAWMNSPDHRDNILNRAFREAGVGIEPGVPEPVPLPGATYTMDYGRRGK
jgi:uncharacterized protein YkwD